jgi:hypothetical protein
VRYAGDGTHAASADDIRVRVTRARSTTTVVAGRATTRRPAEVAVRVRAAVAPTGTVTVTVRDGARTVAGRTAAVSHGSAAVTLPRLAAGRYRVTATYAGSADVARSSGSTALRVTRAGR